MEQKEALLPVLKKHPHPEISDEIRREILNSKSRDVEVVQQLPDETQAMLMELGL